MSKIFALVASLPLIAYHAAHAETPAAARQKLLQQDLIPCGIEHAGVIQSISTTPRHEFVPSSQRSMAYYDMALPIGWKQTISSPFIVAFMTQSLDPQRSDRVLEVGTGSGYQAAILSPLVARVYSIEIVEPLGRRARTTLRRLGYKNVFIKLGDGYQGWEEHAPFDKIIVTCSPEAVPLPLVEQLKEGGIMIIPVGERYQQTLYRYVKGDGELLENALVPTLFVPMTGKAELERDIRPNPRHPSVVNGSFEDAPTTDMPLDGWYYQRQVKRIPQSDGTTLNHVACFENQTMGRSSHALQGFGIDGGFVTELRLTGRIKGQNVVAGEAKQMQAMIIVSFYDRRRALLEERRVGPWTGTFDWKQVDAPLSVPINAREALLRIGLFGATGKLYVDDLAMSTVAR